MHLSALKLTYEDYLHLPEDGRRHELIDGEHFVTPSPSTYHQRISVRLTRILDLHVSTNDLGEVFAAPLDVVLSPVDVLQPDLCFVSRQRCEIITDKKLAGAPDLVIEILSESTRRTDEITKRHLYDKHGVTEYWVVDPVVEAVRVYRRSGEAPDQRYGRPAELRREAGDTVASELLPELAIPLREIFFG